MAHLIRGKQAGIQNDLSFGLTADLFKIDDLERIGVNSQIACLAYDPVQSLLAVGTKSSQFGPGQIYVFGQKRVQVTLAMPPRGANLSKIHFCAEKLVCLDSKHNIYVFSLELKTLLTSHSPPGAVMALCTDPMLDYAFIGMQSGEILAFDLDRESLAPFRIPNLWSEVEPRARSVGIVSLQLHPRDVGTLLIGYVTGAVIYSFKLNKALRFYNYEIPAGAPGGDGDPTTIKIIRRPRLTQAVWHPTGTFILTGYEDSSLAFWDTIKDGRMLMARTLTDTNVATPGSRIAATNSNPGVVAVKEPFYRIAWCANQDPEDTAILIAGGQSTQDSSKGLTLFEMGRTPVYATSAWETFTTFFASPRHQRVLPTPPGAEVLDFCLIPRTSPHFAGAHDPIAILGLLSSGELLTLTFPSGMPISPSNQLHISLTLVHPFIRHLNVVQVGRERWLGMTERRQNGPQILRGGVEAVRPMRRFEDRNIVIAAHADGTLRLWDVGHGDELENDQVLQLDVHRAVGRYDNIEITAASLAGASGEVAVGLASGELVVFRWGTNRHTQRSFQPPPTQPGVLANISDHVESALQEGMIPLTLLNQQDGPVTAVHMSEIGFVAAGFQGGGLAIIDMRGPAVIYTAAVQEFTKSHHRGGSLRRPGSSGASTKQEFVTSLQFSIMMLEHEDYSSILLHAGTNSGHLATFKIIPSASGRYQVQPVGSVLLEHSIKYIHPMSIESGRSAVATQPVMGALAGGFKVSGALVAVTNSSVHVFRPPTAKGAHKSFDSVFCDTAAVIQYLDQGHAIAGLFGDGRFRAYSIPSLREIATVALDDRLDVRRFAEATITPNGTIVGFKGPSEIAVVDIFGTGESLGRSHDRIFNPAALIPPRPTISAVQWVTGTQYITPADMDMLIGGPDRPPSKRMIAQSRAEEEQRRRAERAGGNVAATAASSDESYWQYMQRQIQERTEKLGLAGDGLDNLQENSASWASEVNKYVSRQKRGVATSILKAKFGF